MAKEYPKWLHALFYFLLVFIYFPCSLCPRFEFYFHLLLHAKYNKLNKSSNPPFPTYEMFIFSVFCNQVFGGVGKHFSNASFSNCKDNAILIWLRHNYRYRLPPFYFLKIKHTSCFNRNLKSSFCKESVKTVADLKKIRLIITNNGCSILFENTLLCKVWPALLSFML